ncbi:MAG: helix-turn-helix transcriptional regulator [Cytophagales bacterium]|nr:helix-turn-helix transcriptional regulator [Cytophagales bacterium]
MNSFFTSGFLGATSQSFESELFKISVVNYTSKVSEDWHWHEKFHVSSIIRGGNLESRSKKDIQVTSGKVMTYDQGEVHRNRFTAHPSRNLNIELEQRFFSGDVQFSHLSQKDDSMIELYRIYMELVLQEQYSEQAITQSLQSLFWKGHPENPAQWIPKLETILNDRWNEFIALEELSSELRIHPVTISKYFAKQKGITLSNYMRKIKVKKAIDLLMNSSRSITEIALYCGFSDQSHLTRLTNLYVGHTPLEIRSRC